MLSNVASAELKRFHKKSPKRGIFSYTKTPFPQLHCHCEQTPVCVAIQFIYANMEYKKQWIPAYAGMTVLQGINLAHRRHPDAGRGPLCSEHFLRLNIKNISTFPSGGEVPTGRGGLFSFLCRFAALHCHCEQTPVCVAIQFIYANMEYKKQWIPACAGMTVLKGIKLTRRRHPDAGRGPLCSEHLLRLNIKNISTFPSGGGVPTGRGGLFYSFLFFQSPPTQDGNFLFAKLKHRHSRAGGNPLRSDNF